MLSMSFVDLDFLMFSAEMATFVEGTRLAQDYAVSPTFLIPAFVVIHINSFTIFHKSQQKLDVIFELSHLCLSKSMSKIIFENHCDYYVPQ